MFKFLHLGDIHLGYRQYKLSAREFDFYRAFKDICLRFTLTENPDEKVDFIIISGDLFDSRSASPQSLQRAIHLLKQVKSAGVPVIAIEGNHDFREMDDHTSIKGSWFEVLAEAGLIYFLYPQEGQLTPLSPDRPLDGGYMDLQTADRKIVRLIGSNWMGMKAGSALEGIAAQIKSLPGMPDFTIFLFHGGYEAYFPLSRGGVSMSQFSALEGLVDYIALGHIHLHYEVEARDGKPWIFNPGSLEPTSSSEIGIKRGGLLVEVKEDRSFETRLISDYEQRAACKLKPYEAKKFQDWKTLSDRIRQDALAEIAKVQMFKADYAPLIFLNIQGIPNSPSLGERFDPEKLKGEIEEAGALYCQISLNQVKDHQVSLSTYHQLTDRDQLEKSLLGEILNHDKALQEPDRLLDRMLGLKSLINRETSPEQILESLS
ncbi:MAG: DNA repair exonuclease [Candidatus Caenarcaniphilales bacterium]|nr:DNA repair exonuclease [Candidatus Caenarcaniphilales bacterium]